MKAAKQANQESWFLPLGMTLEDAEKERAYLWNNWGAGSEGGLGPGMVLGQSKPQLQMILSALNPTRKSRQLSPYLKTWSILFYWDSSRLRRILRPRPYFLQGLEEAFLFICIFIRWRNLQADCPSHKRKEKDTFLFALVPNQSHSWLCFSNTRGLHTILHSPNQGWAHSWYLTALVLT